MVGADSGLTFVLGVFIRNILWNICGTPVTFWFSKKNHKREANALHAGADNPTVFILPNKEKGSYKFHLKRC